jgi:SPX domain protein involved in polyphosphate accumulation
MTDNSIFKQNLRYERKFFSYDVDYQQVISSLMSNNIDLIKPYPDRFINNIYCDTVDYEMYRNGVEGNTNRIKVRIRWYGDLIQKNLKPVLEFKRKFGHVGDKLKWPLKPCSNVESMQQVFSSIYDIDNFKDDPNLNTVIPQIHPVLVNRYKRKYFCTHDEKIRITVDSNLLFYPYSVVASDSFAKNVPLYGTVVEVKYLPEYQDKVASIVTEIPIRLSKFSKYIQGCEALTKRRYIL